LAAWNQWVIKPTFLFPKWRPLPEDTERDMNGELIAVLEYLQREKGIDKETLLQAVEQALLQASKKSVGPSRDLRIDIDRTTGAIRALAKLLVVENVTDKNEEISLTDARRINANIQLGESVEVEVTTQKFGRIAAQTAKQAMLQRIRQVEKDMVFEEFKGRAGDIIPGVVRRFERSDVIVDLGRIEGIMPSRERVPTEEYQPGDRIRAYISASATPRRARRSFCRAAILISSKNCSGWRSVRLPIRPSRSKPSHVRQVTAPRSRWFRATRRLIPSALASACAGCASKTSSAN